MLKKKHNKNKKINMHSRISHHFHLVTMCEQEHYFPHLPYLLTDTAFPDPLSNSNLLLTASLIPYPPT